MAPFPDRVSRDARWNAERQAVEFGVEIGEYRGVVRVPRRVFQRLLPNFLGLIVEFFQELVGTSPAKAVGPKPAPVDRGCNFADRRRLSEIGGGQVAEHLGALLTVAVYITPFLLIGLAAKIWIKRKRLIYPKFRPKATRTARGDRGFLLGIWRDEGRE